MAVTPPALESVRVKRLSGIVPKSFRLVIDMDQQTVSRPQPQCARTILIDARDATPVAGGVPRIRTIVCKLPRDRINTGYAVLLSYPYVATPISRDRVNVVRKQAVGIIRVVPIMLELSTAFIESIEPATPSSQPEITACIFVNAINVTALAEGVSVFRAGNIMGDFPVLPIQSIKGAREEPSHKTSLES